MTSIIHANLNWNESGTPVSDQFDDVYFSNHNGLEESRYVFIAQNGLPERFSQHSREYFVVAETGFGTGLNFLALWKTFTQWLSDNPDHTMQRLHFISFEKYPVKLDDLKQAHLAWPELETYAKALHASYPSPTQGCQRIELAQGRVILDLWFGDIHENLPRMINPEQGLVDAWFLDGFAPSKNPDMWNQTLFDAMAQLSKDNATLATFTAAGFVRRGLHEAGFEMKKSKGFGHKREMLVGQYKKAQMPVQAHLMPPAKFQNEQTKEISIIGGGIASACLANQLIKRGYQVCLYCQESVGFGASTNKQGALYPLIAEPEKTITQFFTPAFIYARAYYQNAYAQGISFNHDWCGVSQVGYSDKAQAKLDKMALNQFSNQIIQALNATDLSDKIGLETPYSGVYYPNGGWLCPREATQNIIQSLQKTGKLQCFEHVKVSDFEFLPQTQQWRLNCQKLEHETHSPSSDTQKPDTQTAYQVTTPVLIIANGYQVLDFKQTQAIPTTPVKGQVTHIPAKGELQQLKTVLCYDGYMTPVDPLDHYHCIGASHDRSHINTNYDDKAQHDNVARLQASFPQQKWAMQADASEKIARQGVRSTSRDHLPFIGAVVDFETLKSNYEMLNPQFVRDKKQTMPELSYYPNLYCFVGLGGRGVCSAPLGADILASIIHGESLPISYEVMMGIHPARTWLRRMNKGRPLKANGHD